MQFKVEKLLFFDIESVSQYKDLYDMPEGKLKMWESYYDSFRKKVTDESRIDSELMTQGESTKKFIDKLQHSFLNLVK